MARFLSLAIMGGVLDPMSSLPPFPELKSFSLTHIVYDPTHPFSIPLTLLSLSPIFLFVSYLTLVIFTRRLTILLLAAGQLANEGLNLILKRISKAERPYVGYGEVGRGYGMPSSHAQAAGFLVAWGVGYAFTIERRYRTSVVEERLAIVRRWRARVYLFGLVLWSALVSYSRWHLLYHSPFQIAAGYLAGTSSGTIYFTLTEYFPLYHPNSLIGQIRARIEEMWTSIGGVGGWQLGGAEGGWGEGPLILGTSMKKTS